jgi:23S rRNA (uracil1939-C5)-methyltransferase
MSEAPPPEATVTIEAMGRRGEGIAHLDGKTLFVARTLPGETARVIIDGGRAHLQEIVAQSPERVGPFCKHYDSCGGCQLQHWQEYDYRAWKAGLVVDALAAHGIAVELREPTDAHGAGRRRVSIHARRKGSFVTAGYMALRTHTLVDIDRCPILVPALDRAFDISRAIAARLGDCDVALTATVGGLDAAVKAERKIVAQEHPKLAILAADLKLARLTVNSEVIATASQSSVKMGRAQVVIPPGAFLQATHDAEEELSRFAQFVVYSSKRVADLFSGCGPFTFRMAEQVRVDAFDNDRAAIAALAAAAKNTPGLKPITATVRDLFREPLVANELKDYDAVVFDPPRAGAEAQAKQLAKSKVKTVIAVSCDPQTFARDAAILIGGGYKLESLITYDQFKWTSHVETCAVFDK